MGILASLPLFAQSGSASITGSVADSTGAGIPAATVKVITEDSGAHQQTLTTDGGQYRVQSLLPGTYRLEVAKPGFDNMIRRGLILTTGQTIAVDLALTVGATNETVTIQESSPLAETQSQSIGQLINRRMVEGLPMPNRAASSLVSLAPGVASDHGQRFKGDILSA